MCWKHSENTRWPPAFLDHRPANPVVSHTRERDGASRWYWLRLVLTCGHVVVRHGRADAKTPKRCRCTICCPCVTCRGHFRFELEDQRKENGLCGTT